MHDPVVYPEPEKVIPERFLTTDGGLDTGPQLQGPEGVFGIGKRICAVSDLNCGVPTALTTTFREDLWPWTRCGTLLHVSSLLSPSPRSQTKYLLTGRFFVPVLFCTFMGPAHVCGYSYLLLRHTVPFSCDIKPRSEEIVEAIKMGSNR